MQKATNNPPRTVALVRQPSAPRSPLAGAIDPGPFQHMRRNGDAVILMFERISLVLPRCGAIGLAYWLSELVD